MRRLTPVWIVGLAIATSLLVPPATRGFDSGPHADITRDALTAEGFDETAIKVAQVENWLTDLYGNKKHNPYSGHGHFMVTLLGGGFGDSEHWPRVVTDAAEHSHFDSCGGPGSPCSKKDHPGFPDTQTLSKEWERLRLATYLEAAAARNARDPLRLLAVVGISLHEVQDFYAHSNWIERAWGDYVTAPTWFDVSVGIRDRDRFYVGGSSGTTRTHGTWRRGMNKDWPGRPDYERAYIAAYFASRQWVEALRSWLNDDAFWQRARTYSTRERAALAHEMKGSFEMSFYAGHWQGQGEPCKPSLSFDLCGENVGPGGSLLDLRRATNRYFEGRAKTVFRRTFERTMPRVGVSKPGVELSEDELRRVKTLTDQVPSSQPLQRDLAFVRLAVTQLDDLNSADIGPDQADYYAVAGVGGQSFHSGLIKGKDHFRFPRPNFPFTFLKAAPKDHGYAEPLTSLQIEVKTSNDFLSGTDDGVYLRINPARRFKLDKRLYNDFERGDRDRYSVPIDSALARGLSVGDISLLQLEKSPDGLLGGGWKLGGIKVWANSRLVYANKKIEKWLEDGRRSWRAPDFRPSAPSGDGIPIWIALFDSDGFLYGSDDHADINPFDRRFNVGLAYAPRVGPAGVVTAEARGGSALGGRLGDSDRARIKYRIDTILLQPFIEPPPPPPPPGPPPPPPPPPPAPKADLVISSLTSTQFTVANVGGTAAGPFGTTLTLLTTVPITRTFAFDSLAAGTSETRTFGCGTGMLIATADAQNEIDEGDETNNTRQIASSC